MTLEAALRRARSARVGTELVALRAEAKVDPNDWVAAARPLRAWDTRRSPALAPELVVGVGEAARISARGPERFSEIRRAAGALFESITCLGAARPRLFGGFAFDAERLGAFAELGAAGFVLPRLTAVAAGGQTWVELVVRAHELDHPDRLLREVARLASRPAPRTIATYSVVSCDGASGFLASALGALGAIERGELEKVVVARELELRTDMPLGSVWSRLMQEDRVTCFAHAEERLAFVGATPELLVASEGGRVTSEAVAGTIARRGRDPDEVAELCASDKESREHHFVVEAIVAALSRANAAPRVAARSVRSLARAHHLVTPISADSHAHVLDLVELLHPTPAVCGAPREAAQRWLATNEPLARGWYAGPVGWLDREGQGAFVVALRSALLGPGAARLYAGAGLVRGSALDRELAETELKLAAMRSALAPERGQRHRASNLGSRA